MTWVQRLKPVFGIDIETGPICGEATRIVACIEDPQRIEEILTHLAATAAKPGASMRSPYRASPERGLFD